MTEVGTNYGGALYALAQEESISERIAGELAVLNESFRAEPDFCRLLSSPTLTKAERCQILEESFRDKVHPYVLNFLKILTEKGYMRHFSDCCEAYTAAYHEDNGILPVTAVTASPLSRRQEEVLIGKLQSITGKKILLTNKLDPKVLGGIRLDYAGRRLDDTVSHRMDAIRDVLTKTVL